MSIESIFFDLLASNISLFITSFNALLLFKYPISLPLILIL